MSGGSRLPDGMGAGNLHGHAAQGDRIPGIRDTVNAVVFLREYVFDPPFITSR